MQIENSIGKLCRELKLSSIEENFHDISNTATKENWRYLQFLEELLKREASVRINRSKVVLTKMAGFPSIKTLEQFDFTYSVGVNRKQIEELATLSFISHHENIVFLGESGVGKTHLAIAIAYRAVQNRYKVKFMTLEEILHQANKAKRDRKYNNFLKLMSIPSILIIDEIGYFSMSKEETNHLFQIISKRYEKGSIIFTSNLVFSQWETLAVNSNKVMSAILDRIIHHSHIVNILGNSYRAKEKREEGLLISENYKDVSKN
ncbi:IS21-like element helper ATPase IstB [Campylobacter sp. 7477a]|uniref:IS21-like element helper ATPase IstB n=1 Tax=Campylobacter sp. 7477a TaxID=2735741 RepID=UPI003014583A|nr:ATP-binding protein [Campylobacter sp. 7477a]